MPNKSDAIVKIINNTITAIVKVRKEAGDWSDGDLEDPSQSLLFKRAEGLYTIILPVVDAPERFNKIPYPVKALIGDLKKLLSEIEKDGFDPNPYLYVKAKSQFIDFASFTVLFLSDILKRFKGRKRPSNFPLEIINKVIQKAIRFIFESACKQEEGISWASGSTYDHQGTNLTNVYFTAWAMLALEKVVSSKAIQVEDSEKAERLITQATIWLRNRKQGGTFFGDHMKTKSGINYTTYALIALFKTFEMHNRDIQEFIKNLFKEYIHSIDTLKESPPPIFLDSFLPEVGAPTYYDDRWTDGTILYTLCLARTTRLDKEVFSKDYFNLIKRVQLRLLSQRADNHLWNTSGYRMTSNYWAIKSLILYAEYGEELTFKVTESLLASALKSAMQKPEIVNILLRELQEKAANLSALYLKEK